MKKLIILQGPPASGKTTFAKEYAKEYPDTVIVSRDAIRHSMGEYNMKHESEVTKIEEQQTLDAMHGEKTIINDGTNLNPKYLPKWETLAKENGYEIEYKKFYVPFKEAVRRDQNPDREHHVGKEVIKRFYRMYYPKEYEEEMTKTVEHYRVPENKELLKAVICDIDGTVAWMQNRSPYDTKTVSSDKPDKRMFQLLSILMEAGIDVIFVSGREGTEQCRKDTLEWLKSNIDKKYTDYWRLLMRTEKDYRADEIVKKEIYKDCIEDVFDIVAVFDDRNKVVNMWREIGMLCCQVADGDF